MPTAYRRLWKSLLALGFITLIIITHMARRHYPLDDAYIHIRIARHLAEHGLPYFNLGEPVNASSSTAWLWALAGLIKLGNLMHLNVDMPLWIALLNAIATTAGAWVYTRLLLRLAPRASYKVRAAFGLVYIALLLPSSGGLMETSLALLVVGTALHLLLREHGAAFVLLGAAVFLRYELVVVLLLSFGYALWQWQDHRRWSQIVLYSVLGALPFVAFNAYFFRDLIPHPIRAKSLVYGLSHVASARILLDLLMTFILDQLFPGRVAAILKAFAAGATVVVLAVTLLRQWRAQTQPRPHAALTILIGLWGLLILSAYVLAKATPFIWYVPLYAVPLALVVAQVWATTNASTWVRMPLLVLLLPNFIGYGQILAQNMLGAWVRPAYSSDFAVGAVVRQYVAVGRALYAQYPTATLVTTEIGGLGYGFEGRVVDGLGLVSPDALSYHPMKVPDERSSLSIGALPVGFVNEINPELIVSNEVFIEAFLRISASQRYQHRCYSLFLAEDAAFNSRNHRRLNVFIRKDLPATFGGLGEPVRCASG